MPTPQTATTGVSHPIAAGQGIRSGLCRGPAPQSGRHSGSRPRQRPCPAVLPAGRRGVHQRHRLDPAPATPYPDPGAERHRLPPARAAEDHRTPVAANPDRALPRTQPAGCPSLVRQHRPRRPPTPPRLKLSRLHGFSRSPYPVAKTRLLADLSLKSRSFRRRRPGRTSGRPSPRRDRRRCGRRSTPRSNRRSSGPSGAGG